MGKKTARGSRKSRRSKKAAAASIGWSEEPDELKPMEPDEFKEVKQLARRSVENKMATLEAAAPIRELPVIEFSAGSRLVLTAEEEAILLADVPIDEIQVKHNKAGTIFVHWTFYAKRLNRVFHVGQWVCQPVPGSAYSKIGKQINREFALYIRGNAIAGAMGNCDYIESNQEMSYADAAEGCRGNALMRCCKQIGIALELWDKRFARKFREEYCEQDEKGRWWRKDEPKEQESRFREEDKNIKTGSSNDSGDNGGNVDRPGNSEAGHSAAEQKKEPENKNGKASFIDRAMRLKVLIGDQQYERLLELNGYLDAKEIPAADQKHMSEIFTGAALQYHRSRIGEPRFVEILTTFGFDSIDAFIAGKLEMQKACYDVINKEIVRLDFEIRSIREQNYV